MHNFTQSKLKGVRRFVDRLIKDANSSFGKIAPRVSRLKEHARGAQGTQAEGAPQDVWAEGRARMHRGQEYVERIGEFRTQGTGEVTGKRMGLCHQRIWTEDVTREPSILLRNQLGELLEQSHVWFGAAEMI